MDKIRITDRRQPGFFMIDNAIMLDYNLDPYTFTIYCALVMHANHATGEAWPSISTLAELTGMSRDKTIDSIKMLESVRLIAVERSKKADGSNNVNHYFILDVTGVVAGIDWGSSCHRPRVVADVDYNKNQENKTQLTLSAAQTSETYTARQIEALAIAQKDGRVLKIAGSGPRQDAIDQLEARGLLQRRGKSRFYKICPGAINDKLARTIAAHAQKLRATAEKTELAAIQRAARRPPANGDDNKRVKEQARKNAGIDLSQQPEIEAIALRLAGLFYSKPFTDLTPSTQKNVARISWALKRAGKDADYAEALYHWCEKQDWNSAFTVNALEKWIDPYDKAQQAVVPQSDYALPLDV